MYIKCECNIHFIDINECDDFLVSCEHSCINTVGSYECHCENGYQLHSNGRSCNGVYCKLNPKSFIIFFYICLIFVFHSFGICWAYLNNAYTKYLALINKPFSPINNRTLHVMIKIIDTSTWKKKKKKFV